LHHELTRRALAELVGTAFLVTAVIGSGIAAVRLSPEDVGLQLLENSLVTGAALVALILALQPVSAAFNPVVTLVERAFGAVDSRTAAVLIVVQILGGIVGAVLANLMFGLSTVSMSTQVRSSGGLWLGEVIATLGLVLVIFGTVRSGRTDAVAYAVGGYITAAYWFTSSTSFANPAVAIARMFSDTFAGIAPASVPMFVLMQLLGGTAAFGLIRLLYPHPADLAEDLVHPSERTAVTNQERTAVAHKPTVLFVCVHNAGRSQMAAALLHHQAQGEVDVLSAGSEPADRINPAVVEVMNELELDLSQEFPKPLTDESVRAADVVITMGCGDACPYYPGKRYLDWDLEDPAGKDADTVRRIRDDIDNRVRGLLGELSLG
jgi:protein-tyrosine-phosphatase/glycerol uptake facilitator-like aquaporin